MAKNPDKVLIVTNEVDPNAFPSEGWERIDLEVIWQSELLPLIERSVALQRVHESYVADWLASKRPAMRKRFGRRRWRCFDPTAPSPFFMSSSDVDEMHVDGLIDKARETGDEKVFLYDALMTVLCMLPSRPALVEEWLLEQLDAIWNNFAPARSEIRWWRPAHSCHSFVPFLAMLATAWDPKALWTIARRRARTIRPSSTPTACGYSTGSCCRRTRSPGRSISPNEPVLFAQRSP